MFHLPFQRTQYVKVLVSVLRDAPPMQSFKLCITMNAELRCPVTVAHREELKPVVQSVEAVGQA